MDSVARDPLPSIIRGLDLTLQSDRLYDLDSGIPDVIGLRLIHDMAEADAPYVAVSELGLFVWTGRKQYFGLIIFIPLTNRASPILRFQAGSAITMECICVHKYIYSDYIFYILQLHIT